MILVLIGWWLISRKRKRESGPGSGPDTPRQRAELSSEVPVEMPHDDTSRAGYFYPRAKPALSPHEFASPLDHGSSYHTTRSPGESTVVELPAPAHAEGEEVIYHYQNDRQSSWVYDDDGRIVGRRYREEY